MEWHANAIQMPLSHFNSSFLIAGHSHFWNIAVSVLPIIINNGSRLNASESHKQRRRTKKRNTYWAIRFYYSRCHFEKVYITVSVKKEGNAATMTLNGVTCPMNAAAHAACHRIPLRPGLPVSGRNNTKKMNNQNWWLLTPSAATHRLIAFVVCIALKWCTKIGSHVHRPS